MLLVMPSGNTFVVPAGEAQSGLSNSPNLASAYKRYHKRFTKRFPNINLLIFKESNGRGEQI